MDYFMDILMNRDDRKFRFKKRKKCKGEISKNEPQSFNSMTNYILIFYLDKIKKIFENIADKKEISRSR